MKIKNDVSSILLANWYLTKCSLDKSDNDKKEIARKYLLLKIQNALSERRKSKSNSVISTALILGSAAEYSELFF